MRKGKNPAKLDSNNKVENKAFHQIIVPVYLPELKGYYKEGLDILKLCLESIYLTTHKETFISVVNNGSCAEVKAYLDQCLEKNKIHEVIHTSAIGKINAIAKGLSGHDFDLVTITDADVLFTNGWQKAVYEIYENFPKAGMVGTTPNTKMLKYYTENVHFDNLMNSNFKFRKVINPKEMLAFGESINKVFMFKSVHLENILSLKKDNIIAVIGSGHFTGTYKASLLSTLKSSYITSKLLATSDKLMLDKPSVKYGHWRLCTYDNYTFHLGNIVEDWMYEKINEIIKYDNRKISKPTIKDFQRSSFVKAKQYFINRFIFNKYTRKLYFRYLGLSKKEAQLF